MGAIYDQLTTANFYYRCNNTGLSSTASGAGAPYESTLQSRCQAYFGTFSYNASTGILTCGNGTAQGIAGQPAAPATITSSIAITSTKYCNYIDYE